MTGHAITTGGQGRVVVHLQATVEDRLRCMTRPAGHICHNDAGVTISATSAASRCCRVMHQCFAILDRLAGMTGRAAKLGLVDIMTGRTVLSPGRSSRVMTRSQNLRISVGMTILTIIGGHQLAEVQDIVTGFTVA